VPRYRNGISELIEFRPLALPQNPVFDTLENMWISPAVVAAAAAATPPVALVQTLVENFNVTISSAVTLAG